MKKQEGIRKQMYANIHGCNKYLIAEYLDTLNWQELLRNCHPIDRPIFVRELQLLGLI